MVVKFSTVDARVFPAPWNTPPHTIIAPYSGSANASIRSTCVPSATTATRCANAVPNQRGSAPLMLMPSTMTAVLNSKLTNNPNFIKFRDSFPSPASILCATNTRNPVETAIQSSLNNHVVEATKPMAAD